MSLKDAYPDILKTYLKIAKKFAGKNKVILKTDAFNEANGRPIEGGIAGNIKGEIHVIEIRPEYVGKAQLIGGLKVSRQDIRDIKYGREKFDVVMDFSTIDHVRDWRVVLREYWRVLKPGGILSLVYWAKPALEYEAGQYYFPAKPFDDDFRRIFKVISHKFLYSDLHRQQVRKLIHLVGVKPGGEDKKPRTPRKPAPESASKRRATTGKGSYKGKPKVKRTKKAQPHV